MRERERGLKGVGTLLSSSFFFFWRTNCGALDEMHWPVVWPAEFCTWGGEESHSSETNLDLYLHFSNIRILFC